MRIIPVAYAVAPVCPDRAIDERHGRLGITVTITRGESKTDEAIALVAPYRAVRERQRSVIVDRFGRVVGKGTTRHCCNVGCHQSAAITVQALGRIVRHGDIGQRNASEEIVDDPAADAQVLEVGSGGVSRDGCVADDERAFVVDACAAVRGVVGNRAVGDSNRAADAQTRIAEIVRAVPYRAADGIVFADRYGHVVRQGTVVYRYGFAGKIEDGGATAIGRVARNRAVSQRKRAAVSDTAAEAQSDDAVDRSNTVADGQAGNGDSDAEHVENGRKLVPVDRELVRSRAPDGDARVDGKLAENLRSTVSQYDRSGEAGQIDGVPIVCSMQSASQRRRVVRIIAVTRDRPGSRRRSCDGRYSEPQHDRCSKGNEYRAGAFHAASPLD